MTHRHSLLAACLAITVSGCASVEFGDKSVEANLRKLLPVAGKTSLYVCREAAVFAAAGNRATIVVNNRPIGTLKPNNFAHVVLDPGSHQIYLKRNPGGESGVLTITSQAGQVVIIWAGMTGGGWGALTVDHFSKRR